QVKKAVAVHIADSYPHVRFSTAQAVVGEASLHRFLLERSVALVDPQVVGLAVVADEDVGPAIAIEIGTENSQARTGLLAQAGFQGHILEADGERGARSAERHFLRSALRAPRPRAD